MGLLNIFKFKKPTPADNNNQWSIYAQKMSVVAIEYANEFDKKLDYSEKSIIDLEEILDWYSKDIPVSKPTENQIWSMSMVFGSYLGETLLRNGLSKKGFIWGTEPSSDIPLLIKEDVSYLTPNDKVYKRLVNGCEDNVVSFYKFAQTKYNPRFMR